MAIARMRRACLASAVRAASARNCEILRSWRVISFAYTLFGNPPGVKFLGGWYKLAGCPFHDVRVKLCAAGLRRRHRETFGIKTPGKRMIVW
jgi:hypothetical protein